MSIISLLNYSKSRDPGTYWVRDPLTRYKQTELAPGIYFYKRKEKTSSSCLKSELT